MPLPVHSSVVLEQVAVDVHEARSVAVVGIELAQEVVRVAAVKQEAAALLHEELTQRRSATCTLHGCLPSRPIQRRRRAWSGSRT